MNMPNFKTLYKPIIFIFLGYIILLILLNFFGFLPLNDLLNNITVFLGWVLALLILFIQLRRTLTDNLTIQREEKRKSFEIEAYKEINKKVTNLSEKVTNTLTRFIILPGDLELHIQNPSFFKFDLQDVDMKIRKGFIDLLHAESEFILTIEAYEIAVIEFDYLRKFIQFKLEDVRDLISNFSKYLMNIKLSQLYEDKHKLEFELQCKKICDGASDISSWLYDYRIELMNYFLKGLFDKRVPPRKPQDPKSKLLTEVAKKEEVIKEEEMRYKKAMTKN